MGDRTWTNIRFSGTITKAQAEELLQELEAQNCHCDEGSEGGLTVEHLTLDTYFYDEDCNYASMDGVEAWCKANHVSYFKSWSPGGGYGEGATLYMAVVDQEIDVPTTEGEVTASYSFLREQLKQGKTLEDVVNFCAHIEQFNKHYPPLEISDA